MSTNIPEWPENLPVPQLDRKHGLNPRSEPTQMESSRVRKRRLFDIPLEQIDVRWNFTAGGFNIFKDFFDNTLLNGSLPFAMTTIDPSTGELTTNQYSFAESNYQSQSSDNLHSVSALLEITGDSWEDWNDPSFTARPGREAVDALDITYPTICKDEFVCTIPRLAQDTIYQLEIALDKDGPWEPHIYFALQTSDEKTSLTKVLHINNDYGGKCWFRAVKILDVYGTHYGVVKRSAKALASAIAAPVVSITNLSEITDDIQTAAHGLSSTGLRSLQAVSMAGTGFFRPISVVEDPLVEYETRYFRYTKKYAARQMTAAGDSWADLDGTGHGFNYPVVMTGEDGTTTVFTRDGTDPTLTTVMRTLDDVANNSAPYQKSFSGQIKVRSFKNGCKSPLTVIAVDRFYFECPNVGTASHGNTVTGSCDLARGGSESGNSCNNIWGGSTAFEVHIQDAAEGSLSPQSDGSSQPLVFLRTLRIVDTTDYLGWTNHFVASSAASLTGMSWRRPTDWNNAYPNHNWAVMTVNFSVPIVTEFQYNATICTTGGLTALSGWDDSLVNAMSGAIENWGASEDGYPYDDAFTGLQLTRCDVVCSPLGNVDVVETYWGIQGSVLILTPPPSGTTPSSETSSTLETNIDNWESYSPTTNADAAMLGGGNGFSGNWVVETFVAVRYIDDFEYYSVGSADSPVSLNAGDGFTSAWVITTPVSGITYGDDFESYSVGQFDSGGFGGTGFTTGLGEGWVCWPQSTDTIDSFETYAVGVADGLTMSAGTGFVGNWLITTYP